MSIKTVTNTISTLIIIVLMIFSINVTTATTNSIQNIEKLRVINDTIYIIDSTQNALFFGTQDEIYTDKVHCINTRLYNNVQVQFNALKQVCVTQDGTIYLIDGQADGIFEYDSNGTFTKEHIRFEDGSLMTDIISICSNYNNNVYALQFDDGLKILKKEIATINEDEEYFTPIIEITNEQLSEQNITVDSSALLVCDFEKEIFYVATNGKLLKIDSQSLTLLTTYENIATDIAVDYLGCPYLSLNDGTILKYQNGTTQFLQLQTNTFSLNFENGDINYVSPTEPTTISTYPNNFVNNLSKFKHPVDYSVKNNLQESVQIFETTVEANLYQYPLKVAQLTTTLPQNTKIIKLADVENYENYSYILISIDGVLTPCYILSANIQQANNDELSEYTDLQMRTYTTNTRLYKYPTADTFENNTSLYLTTIPQTTEVTVINNVYNFSDSQGRTFYEIVYQDKIYYVMQTMLTTLSTEEGVMSLKPANAKLNCDHAVNIYSGLNSSNVIGNITPETKFYVDISKFNTKAERTYIEFLDSNNNYVSGFIDTKYIDIDELSPFVVVAIFLILIVIILILLLILYFAKERKKIKSQLNE